MNEKKGSWLMPQEHSLCSKCVCGSGLPGLTIDEGGICSECRQDSLVAPPTQKLVDVMEGAFKQFRNTQAPYDVLVMASGGKDSSYLQYMLKEKYGLRILACMVVHPFVNDLAAGNAEHVSRKIGVDLVKFLADGEIWRRALNLGLRDPQRYGLTEMVGCTICSRLYDTVATKMALFMGIPCVVNGHDRALHATPILMDGQRYKAVHMATGEQSGVVKVIQDALGRKYRGSIYDPDFSRYADANWPAKIFPLTFIDYEYPKIMQEMEDLGILTKTNARPSDTNCLLVHLLGYIGFQRYDCHPYARPTSQALRRNNSTYLEQFFTTGDRRLSRDEHVRSMAEYRAALSFIVEHPNATEEDLVDLQSQLSFLNDVMGEERLSALLERLMGIHELASYLDLELGEFAPCAAS
jgi:hypothetical protein